MSGALDQLLLEDIAKFCPESFLGYHKCMMENRENPGQCQSIQLELSKCIKSKVPSMIKIQTSCLDKLKNYENCLKDNSNNKDPTLKCFDDLQNLRKCANDALS